MPRQYIGEASRFEEPVMVVSLTRQLEARAGSILPFERKIIQFPTPTPDRAGPQRQPSRPGQVVNIRLETAPVSKKSRWIGAAVLLSMVALAVVADVAKQVQSRQSSGPSGVWRGYLKLNGADDYQQVIRKMGLPSTDRIIPGPGCTLRVLKYAPRRYSVILKGDGADVPRYIGSVDTYGRALDWVSLAPAGSSEALLRLVPVF